MLPLHTRQLIIQMIEERYPTKRIREKCKVSRHVIRYYRAQRRKERKATYVGKNIASLGYEREEPSPPPPDYNAIMQAWFAEVGAETPAEKRFALKVAWRELSE